MTDLQAILDKGGPWERARIIGDQLLIQGDCREVMAVLPKVDAVVTDPPYGIGYQHSGKSGGRWHRSNTKPIINDDKAFDPSPLLRFPEILIWGADHFRRRLPDGGRMLAWNKLGGLPDMGDSFGNVEFAWHSRKGKADIISCTWKGIIRVGSGEQGGARYHPSQKPIAVMEWCLRKVSCGTILDPFAGSFTTAVACQRLGRQSISIELDPDYFSIGCKRVDEAARQPALFTPEPQPKPQQEQLL